MFFCLLRESLKKLGAKRRELRHYGEPFINRMCHALQWRCRFFYSFFFYCREEKLFRRAESHRDEMNPSGKSRFSGHYASIITLISRESTKLGKTISILMAGSSANPFIGVRTDLHLLPSYQIEVYVSGRKREKEGEKERGRENHRRKFI